MWKLSMNFNLATRSLDFDDIRANPSVLSQNLDCAAFDDVTVNAQLAKWNPTKRNSNREVEQSFLQELHIK